MNFRHVCIHHKPYMSLGTILICLLFLFSLAVSCTSEPPREPTPAPTPPPELTPSPLPKPSLEPKPPAGPTISIGETQMTIDEVVAIDITIHGMTEGLSGYDFTVTLENAEIAQIVDIDLPEFGLTDTSNTPSDAVKIRAVDLKDIISSETGESLLATLKVQGIKLGTSAINIIVNAMDDDDGNPVEPYVASGTIEVR